MSKYIDGKDFIPSGWSCTMNLGGGMNSFVLFWFGHWVAGKDWFKHINECKYVRNCWNWYTATTFKTIPSGFESVSNNGGRPELDGPVMFEPGLAVFGKV